jgi:hypothetical protein
MLGEYKVGEIFGEIKKQLQSGYSLRDALELMDALSFRSQEQKHELSHQSHCQRVWSARRRHCHGSD